MKKSDAQQEAEKTLNLLGSFSKTKADPNLFDRIQPHLAVEIQWLGFSSNSLNWQVAVVSLLLILNLSFLGILFSGNSQTISNEETEWSDYFLSYQPLYEISE